MEVSAVSGPEKGSDTVESGTLIAIIGRSLLCSENSSISAGKQSSLPSTVPSPAIL